MNQQLLPCILKVIVTENKYGFRFYHTDMDANETESHRPRNSGKRQEAHLWAQALPRVVLGAEAAF